MPVYVAVVGCHRYHGTTMLKPGMMVTLLKEPDNLYDDEAIAVMVDHLGRIGYVANSVHTVPKGCRSAGRVYDTFGEKTTGWVRFVAKDLVIVELGESPILGAGSNAVMP